MTAGFAGTRVALLRCMSNSRPRAHSYSEVEEEFFRAGAEPGHDEPVETFADLDEGYRPVSLWRRLFGRSTAGSK